MECRRIRNEDVSPVRATLEEALMTVQDTPLSAPVVGRDGSAAPTSFVLRSQMADPIPIAFGVFAFALVVYGVRFVAVDTSSIHGPTSDALNYAILIAGVAQLLAGAMGIARGISYRGWVTSIFGVWLIGFYLLLTHQDQAAVADTRIVGTGPDGKPLPAAVSTALKAANLTAWHAESVAWYVLVLIIPVLILAIPSFIRRNVPFMIAFAAIIVLLLLLGLGFHDVYNTVTDVTRGRATAPHLQTAVNLLRASAWMAFLAAASIFWVFGKEVVLPAETAERH